MKTTYHLVEEIAGSEYNIYSGTEKECKKEMNRILKVFGTKANPMHITFNRFD